MRILILLILISNSIFCQKIESSKFSISIGVNPFIFTPNSITDLNLLNQGDEVIFSKNNQFSSEFYLTSNYRLNDKWRVGIGLSYIQTNYNFSNYIEVLESFGNQLPPDSKIARNGHSISFTNSLRVNYLGVKLQTSYTINKTNSLTVGLDIQKFTNGKFNSELSGTRGNENVKISEESGAFYQNKGVIVVPEIFIKTQLFKSLYLTYGAKMRFWNNTSKNLYELNYQYYDYNVIDYTISTRNFGLFLGLNYQFQFKKEK